jgi:hypothetical protein
MYECYYGCSKQRCSDPVVKRDHIRYGDREQFTIRTVDQKSQFSSCVAVLVRNASAVLPLPSLDASHAVHRESTPLPPVTISRRAAVDMVVNTAVFIEVEPVLKASWIVVIVRVLPVGVFDASLTVRSKHTPELVRVQGRAPLEGSGLVRTDPEPLRTDIWD